MGNAQVLGKAAPKEPADVVENVANRSFLLAAVAIALAVCVTAGIAATRGRFEQLIVEFEMDVPTVTAVALSPLFPVALAVLVALTIVKELIPGIDPIANHWNRGVTCLALVALAIYVIGVASPLMSLIQALS
ncbi:MAG: hypothetical protein RIC55_10050 [Pirellulaceae bacterium]